MKNEIKPSIKDLINELDDFFIILANDDNPEVNMNSKTSNKAQNEANDEEFDDNDTIRP